MTLSPGQSVWPGAVTGLAPMENTGLHGIGHRTVSPQAPTECRSQRHPSFRPQYLNAENGGRPYDPPSRRLGRLRFRKADRHVERQAATGRSNRGMGDCHRIISPMKSCDGPMIVAGDIVIITTIAPPFRVMMLPSCAKNIATYPHFRDFYRLPLAAASR
jgi:hypothetical protein